MDEVAPQALAEFCSICENSEDSSSDDGVTKSIHRQLFEVIALLVFSKLWFAQVRIEKI